MERRHVIACSLLLAVVFLLSINLSAWADSDPTDPIYSYHFLNGYFIKFDTDGNQKWRLEQNESFSFLVNSLGESFLFWEDPENDDSDQITLIDSDGNKLWTVSLEEENADGMLLSHYFQLGPNNTLYQYSDYTSDNTDDPGFFIKQMTKQGEDNWTLYESKKILWLKDGNFIVNRMGNAYVFSYEKYSDIDLFLQKVNANGDIQWTKNINNPYEGKIFHNPHSLAIDENENVYILGLLFKADDEDAEAEDDPYETSGQFFIFLVKFNDSGQPIWWHIKSIGSENEYGLPDTQLALGNDNNLVVMYQFESDSCTLMHYSENGELLHEKDLNNDQIVKKIIPYHDDGFTLVSIDKKTEQQTKRIYTLMLQKFTFSMKQTWETYLRLSKTYEPWGSFHYFSLAANDDLYLTTVNCKDNIIEAEVPTLCDQIIAKYDAQGNQIWERLLEQQGNYDLLPFGIGLDSSGNVYVAGGKHLLSDGFPADDDDDDDDDDGCGCRAGGNTTALPLTAMMLLIGLAAFCFGLRKNQ